MITTRVTGPSIRQQVKHAFLSSATARFTVRNIAEARQLVLCRAPSIVIACTVWRLELDFQDNNTASACLTVSAFSCLHCYIAIAFLAPYERSPPTISERRLAHECTVQSSCSITLPSTAGLDWSEVVCSGERALSNLPAIRARPSSADCQILDVNLNVSWSSFERVGTGLWVRYLTLPRLVL